MGHKHDTLLHKELSDDQNSNSNNRKQSFPQNHVPTYGNVNSFSKSPLWGSFVQVLHAYCTGKKTFKNNALLDSGSDSTLASKTLADNQIILEKNTS